MAKLRGNIITGPLGPISLYNRHDLDQNLARSKGGPSKEQIEKAPQFERTRKNNMEFDGRAKISGSIMQAFWQLKPMGDYFLPGQLNSLVRHIQLMDEASEVGKRHVQLTKYPSLLEGFSLNRKRLFNSIIRSAVSYTLSREERMASVQIPALVPQINFQPQVTYPMYSIVATLGVIPDWFYVDKSYSPSSPKYKAHGSLEVCSPWHPVMQASPAQTLELKYPVTPPDEAHSLVLGIGIRFGRLSVTDKIEQVPRAGSAKVLTVV